MNYTPLDALVYVSLLAKSQLDWVGDSIGCHTDLGADFEPQLDTLDDLSKTIIGLRDVFTGGCPFAYSNGRRTFSEFSIENGALHHVVWHPDATAVDPYEVRSRTAEGQRYALKVDTHAQNIIAIMSAGDAP